MKTLEQKEKLIKLNENIRQCLIDENFSNQEKQLFFDMTTKVIAMLLSL